MYILLIDFVTKYVMHSTIKDIAQKGNTSFITSKIDILTHIFTK